MLISQLSTVVSVCICCVLVFMTSLSFQTLLFPLNSHICVGWGWPWGQGKLLSSWPSAELAWGPVGAFHQVLPTWWGERARLVSQGPWGGSSHLTHLPGFLMILTFPESWYFLVEDLKCRLTSWITISIKRQVRLVLSLSKFQLFWKALSGVLVNQTLSSLEEAEAEKGKTTRPPSVSGFGGVFTSFPVF